MKTRAVFDSRSGNGQGDILAQTWNRGIWLPPGQVQGLITAYCLGPTVCPNWINSARPA